MNPALPSHRRPAAIDRFYFGSCYYPDHWDEATRANDPVRMKAAGWNCVRVGEFAWDLMEPREGQFNFALFDETIARLGSEGIVTIFGTPTAAPPRWLSLKHPEILRVNADGVSMQHGSRQHASHASPVFREYCKKITRALAEHYRDNPHVVGWQTDNEFHCHFSEDHSPAAQTAFVEFLRKKFRGDIGALNRAWGTAFWAQTYDAFEDIQTCRDRKPTYVNPAHHLDYFRFLSDAATQFQRDQVEILRSTQPRWFVTHNGCFERLDYRGEFGRDLDMLGYDSYPLFDFNPDTRAASQAFNLDRARSWTGNFLLLEQQSGPGGQATYFHDTPEPGEMRRMAYSSIARGADSLLFFRWRTCRFGAEEYWCGILDHDNIPRRRYHEAAQMGREMADIGPEVLGTSVRVDVAVASSEVNVNDTDSIYPLGLPSADLVAKTVHGWFLKRGYATGCVHPADSLEGVKALILPHWAYFDPAWVAGLEVFVERGGVLVIGARTATRDTDNNITAATLPGVLRDLAGATIEEYGRQNAPDKRPRIVRLGDASVLSAHWYEWLEPDPGTDVLATWEGAHLTGCAAITSRKVGAGRVVYVGTYLTSELCEILMPHIVGMSGLEPQLPNAPEGVEIVQRIAAGKTLWFLINHNAATVEIANPPQGVDLITQEPTTNRIALAAHDVAVISQR